MANGETPHISPTATNVLAMLAVGVSVVSYLLQPTARDIERLSARLDRHESLPGHPKVLSEVANVRAGLDTLRATIAGNDRNFLGLHDGLDHRMLEAVRELQLVEDRQLSNMEREARMDESIRNMDKSMPPLAEQMATVQARLAAAMTRIDMLEHR